MYATSAREEMANINSEIAADESLGPIQELGHITDIRNLKSILEIGILSSSAIAAFNRKSRPLFSRTELKKLDMCVAGPRPNESGYTAGPVDFSNSVRLYFQPRNALLYEVVKPGRKHSAVVIWVDPSIISNTPMGVSFTDGAPASTRTRHFQFLPEGIKEIGRFYNSGKESVFHRGWWAPEDANGLKRRMQAECILPHVPPEYIKKITVQNPGIEKRVRGLIGENPVEITIDPSLFFGEQERYKVTDRLNVVDGDMFLSDLQTITVTVNLKGVMGAGIADRARRQFPDVYVRYEELLRRKTLRMGKPALYKRELPLDFGLRPGSSSGEHRWFLLFATKDDWRRDSDLNGIRAGLQWIKDNYKKEVITGLALPALGCGNGNLDWQDVGPIICQELAELDIPVEIYLPKDYEIPPESLNPLYLIGSQPKTQQLDLVAY